MVGRRTKILIGLALAALVTGTVTLATGGFDRSQPNPRVVLYGDSLSVESARFIEADLRRADPRVRFENRAYAGTAPCDWYDQARKDSEQETVAVIIEAFGNNQSECQLSKAGNRPRSEGDRYWLNYRKSLRKLIAMFPKSTTVYLTVPPAAYNDDSEGRSHSHRMLVTMRKAARHHPNARVVNAGKVVETRDGNYTRSLPCLKDEPLCTNQPKRGSNLVRAEDGLHFCPPVLKATVEELGNCPVYASGAWRFGRAQAARVVELLRVRLRSKH